MTKSKEAPPAEFRPATKGGRVYAVQALQARREKNKAKRVINNNTQPAGAPMVFDCITCNGNIVVPENYITKPSLCSECFALKELGWLE